MSKCGAQEGFYQCELQADHTCRHRDGDYTWVDELVTAARAQARQTAAPTPQNGPDALLNLLACLKGVSAIVDWKTSERQKAVWFDAILDRYREIGESRESNNGTVR